MAGPRGSRHNSRTRTILIAVSLALVAVVAVATIGGSAIANLAASLQGRQMAAANTAPSVAAASTTGGGWQPDPYLSKLIIAEQQESREYYRRLAEGQIIKIVVQGVGTEGGKRIVRLRASFTGMGDQDFRAEFTGGDGGDNYLFQTTQGSPLASVANIGPEEQALGRRILRQQHRYQRIIRDLVNNKIAWLQIRSVDQRTSKSVLDCVVRYRNGTSVRGIMTMQYMNGFWYVVSIKKA